MEKENVWDYPRPAKCEAFSGSVCVKHQGIIIASTTRAMRALETFHPPCYYFPWEDVASNLLRPNAHRSFCEWKGVAHYFDLVIDDLTLDHVAWSYPNTSQSFTDIKGFVSFYASKFDECYVNDELAVAQAGDFYGGWITSNLEGPFKQKPGSVI